MHVEILYKQVECVTSTQVGCPAARPYRACQSPRGPPSWTLCCMHNSWLNSSNISNSSQAGPQAMKAGQVWAAWQITEQSVGNHPRPIQPPHLVLTALRQAAYHPASYQEMLPWHDADKQVGQRVFCSQLHALLSTEAPDNPQTVSLIDYM